MTAAAGGCCSCCCCWCCCWWLLLLPAAAAGGCCCCYCCCCYACLYWLLATGCCRVLLSYSLTRSPLRSRGRRINQLSYLGGLTLYIYIYIPVYDKTPLTMTSYPPCNLELQPQIWFQPCLNSKEQKNHTRYPTQLGIQGKGSTKPRFFHGSSHGQWEFQDPKMEVR